MKKLPIGISNFKMMIEGDYIYVDKTRIIYELLSTQRLFFLSRPRRFGKSLLISTLKELFSGNKHLFNNTWIGKSDYTWQEYPVIYLDFSRLSIETSEEFKIHLSRSLELFGESVGIDLSKEPLLNSKLERLVVELSKKQKVVILIDEYDYPILKNLDNPIIAKAMQKVTSSFFAAIKSFDGAGYIHSIFITGVTKFSKTTIFSGMNNLFDLTMSSEAAALLGYTKEELRHYFAAYAKDFAEQKKIPLDQVFNEIQSHYNGYRFSKDDIKVFNPYSVLLCFSKKDFENYWFETGTPSFLIDLIKKQATKIKNIETIELSSSSLGSFDLDSIHIIPILFQTGYLTILEYDEAKRSYILGYPNSEVKDSFYKYLVVGMTESTAQDVDRAIVHFKEALNTNNIELFCTTLKSLLAAVPYQLHVANEAYYHSLLHLLITLIGLEGESEISTSKGRIDLIINTKQRIFIFEFKFQGSGKKALEQILEQKYYEKYMRLKKPITLVGLSFNIKKKELFLDWVTEELLHGKK